MDFIAASPMFTIISYHLPYIISGRQQKELALSPENYITPGTGFTTLSLPLRASININRIASVNTYRGTTPRTY